MEAVDQKTLARVIKIARNVRQWAEENRSDDFDRSLCGMCAIAAAELFRRLTNCGIQSKIAMWEEGWEAHCYVIVDNQLIVDVTASQFGRSNVEVVSHHTTDLPVYWRKPNKLFNDVRSLIEHQIKQEWPFEQIAYE